MHTIKRQHKQLGKHIAHPVEFDDDARSATVEAVVVLPGAWPELADHVEGAHLLARRLHGAALTLVLTLVDKQTFVAVSWKIKGG